ncbi:MAG TPA: NUDIX hydrolase [Ktedonobacterales bacterium]|nr:NUDIX hydrolase [Ktedonobacterales bacterium]
MADDPPAQPPQSLPPDPPDEPAQPWTVLGSELVYATPWLALRQDRLRTHTDREITYTYLTVRDAVFVVPVTDGGEVVLLRQYRHTVRAWCWEVPAGALDAGEDAPTAAARELREEVGGVCRELRPLGTFFASNGVSDERFHLFLARGVLLGANALEHTELLRVAPLPAAQALALARAGAITDGPSALALLLAAPLLAPR